MDLKKVIYILNNPGNVWNAKTPVGWGCVVKGGRHDESVSGILRAQTMMSERRCPARALMSAGVVLFLLTVELPVTSMEDQRQGLVFPRTFG